MSRSVAGFALAGVLASMLSTGCTSFKVVENADESRPYSSVAVGDRIRVRDRSGVATEFEVTAIGADFVEGETRKHDTVRIDFADIEEMREREISWTRTTLLGLGVGYLVAIAAAAAALVSLL